MKPLIYKVLYSMLYATSIEKSGSGSTLRSVSRYDTKIVCFPRVSISAARENSEKVRISFTNVFAFCVANASCIVVSINFFSIWKTGDSS